MCRASLTRLATEFAGAAAATGASERERPFWARCRGACTPQQRGSGGAERSILHCAASAARTDAQTALSTEKRGREAGGELCGTQTLAKYSLQRARLVSTLPQAPLACRHCVSRARMATRAPLHAPRTVACARSTSPLCSRTRPFSRATRHAGAATEAQLAVEVVLSSGFLAFAAHSGFLAAVEDAGLAVSGVMGTSAGALAGSLFSAGYEPRELANILNERTPLSYLTLNSAEPWSGVFRLDGAVARLRELLPATFEELPVRFACGVIDRDGQHRTISTGPLPEAVAASMAIPCLFAAVHIPGSAHAGPFADGGKVDRVGLRPWRRLQAPAAGQQAGPPVVCHVIERSSPFSGDDDVEAAAREAGLHESVLLVRSPRSRQSLLALTDFQPQFDAARQRATDVLATAPQLRLART